jgi:ParB-like chromosome segregation protein Spo0J
METQDDVLRWADVSELLAEAPFPPRGEVGSLDLLTSSVRLHGLISPLLVRVLPARSTAEPAAGAGSERMQVVCGYRRLLAAQAAGLAQVPVFVRRIGDLEALRCFLTENSCRKDLSNESRSEVLDLLKRLRDSGVDDSVRYSRPAEPRAESRLVEPSASQDVSRRGSFFPLGRRARDLALPSAIEDADERPRAPEIQALVERAQQYFAEVFREKAIDLDAARRLTLELLAASPSTRALTARDLYVPGRGTWLAEHALLSASLNGWLAPVDADSAERETYALAGFLHDAGMVFLDQQHLAEPRAMSPGQRIEVQRHTRIGEALILSAGQGSREVERLAAAAREHHERHDGRGYPDGRRGSELERLSRATALTDTFASLVGPRPHRDSLSATAALERLRTATELGLYDPELWGELCAVLDAEMIPASPREPAGAVYAEAVTSSDESKRD